MPAGATTPSPVIATRRNPAGSVVMLVDSDFGNDEVVGGLDGLDAFEVFFGDFDVELLFERHHELDQVEAVCIEIVAEFGVQDNSALLDREHFDGALAEACEQFFIHGDSPICWLCRIVEVGEASMAHPEPTVDRDHCAGNVRAIRPGQETDDAGDLVRIGHACERHCGGDRGELVVGQ